MGVNADRFRERRVASDAMTGEGDNQGPVQAWLRAELFCQAISVHVREIQIEQHEIRRISDGRLECPRAGGRMFDLMTKKIARQITGNFRQTGMIFDQE